MLDSCTDNVTRRFTEESSSLTKRDSLSEDLCWSSLKLELSVLSKDGQHLSLEGKRSLIELELVETELLSSKWGSIMLWFLNWSGKNRALKSKRQ